MLDMAAWWTVSEDEYWTGFLPLCLPRGPAWSCRVRRVWHHLQLVNNRAESQRQLQVGEDMMVALTMDVSSSKRFYSDVPSSPPLLLCVVCCPCRSQSCGQQTTSGSLRSNVTLVILSPSQGVTSVRVMKRGEPSAGAGGGHLCDPDSSKEVALSTPRANAGPSWLRDTWLLV